ncbi:5-formyltetrahydrofolate cyclo-ligase [Paenibacillus sp. MBLB4367]|uniref:5-formyltetrahydrofolate cyclo-ligase n=1 Tax=Paenibacillus sp. MBLB4367 TaxID=3384767 RepID=UPI0039083647
MTVSEQKRIVRKLVEAQRSAIPAEERQKKSADICRRSVAILEKLDWAGGKALMTYVPFRSEVDVSPLIEWCWQQGVVVAAPRSLTDRRLLQLHAISDWPSLESGAYGIREPRESCPLLSHNEISCVIVPGIAFDEQLGRLGYGGGYYDRFFEGLAGKRPQPLKLAPAFDIQIVTEAPMDAHDIRVDRVVTETRDFVKEAPADSEA